MPSIRSLLLWSSLAAVLALTGAASARPAKPDAPVSSQPRFAPAPPGAIAATTVPQAGQAMFVEWGGSYWPATAIAVVDSSRVVIHYVGWGNEWDELASRDRWAFEVAMPHHPRAGERLFVEWRGSYWPAQVLSVQGPKVRIHYEGYGSQWDETVGLDRLKQLRTPTIQRPAVGQLAVGDPIQVRWGGRWWPATVIRLGGQGRYGIHYDGYGPEWDEVVGLDRIRLRP